jgi:hypothetical protein
MNARILGDAQWRYKCLMLKLCLLLLLTQNPANLPASGRARAAPSVIVVDISNADAIYEDVSRSYAEVLVAQLQQEKFDAKRVDQDEMDGCHLGPCLGKVAYKFLADVVVTLDAEEIDTKKGKVVLSALDGKTGMPLALARGVFTLGKPVPKSVKSFGAKLRKALAPK